MMLHLYLTPADDFWLLTTALWVMFSVTMLHRYRTALGAARRIADPDVRTLGIQIMHDFLRAESFRLTGHIASIIVGVAAATVVPRPVDTDARVATAVIAIGLIVLNCVQGANSINAYVSWRHRERRVLELERRNTTAE